MIITYTVTRLETVEVLDTFQRLDYPTYHKEEQYVDHDEEYEVQVEDVIEYLEQLFNITMDDSQKKLVKLMFDEDFFEVIFENDDDFEQYMREQLENGAE